VLSVSMYLAAEWSRVTWDRSWSICSIYSWAWM